MAIVQRVFPKMTAEQFFVPPDPRSGDAALYKHCPDAAVNKPYGGYWWNEDRHSFLLYTQSGTLTVRSGDWIIQDQDGKLAVVSAEEFEKTYRVVS